MTIYVDNARIKSGNDFWSHLISDSDDDEIHIFAGRIGLKREWFQHDHYDITAGKRIQAIKAGAIEVSAKEIVQIRREKRHCARKH
jgi:hypothetical protein